MQLHYDFAKKQESCQTEDILNQLNIQKSKADMLQSMVDTLQNENEQLKASAVSTATDLNDRTQRLHGDKDILRDKIDKLGGKINKLQDERIRLKDDLHLKDLQLRSAETLEQRIKDKFAEVSQLNIDLAKLKSKEVEKSEKLKKALAELAAGRVTQIFQSKEVASLKDRVSQLKGDKKAFWKLRQDMTRYVTHLDLAFGEFRVYTCSHNRLKSLPDGNNSTCEHDADSLAWEMFGDWRHDTVFMDEYSRFRAEIVSHHYLHEQKDWGRGDYWRKIENTRRYFFFPYVTGSLIPTVKNVDRSRRAN